MYLEDKMTRSLDVAQGRICTWREKIWFFSKTLVRRGKTRRNSSFGGGLTSNIL